MCARSCQILALLFGFALLACSSDDEADPCSRVCDRAIECSPQSDKKQCLENCSVRLVSEACADAVTSAACDEVNQELSTNPGWADTCYPPCTGGAGECSGDTLTLCNNGREYRSPCSEVCKAVGRTYSGICGHRYVDQECSNGGDCCWCK